MARTVAVAGLVIVGVLAVWQLVPTDRSRHDDAVGRLQRQAEVEEGWVVVELPNIHEGGGHTTWWLHPCDPRSDASRDVTRTAYHGSDVTGIDGQYLVEHDSMACDEPTTDVEVGSRHLRLDVQVVDLGRSYGLRAAQQDVTVTDLDDGTEHTLAPGSPVIGSCDGWAAWVGSRLSNREVALTSSNCTGSVAALPEDARDLLRRSGGVEPTATSVPLSPDAREPFGSALAAAGWHAGQIRSQSFDGSAPVPLWRGPCGTDGDGRRMQTLVVVADGAHLDVRPC